MRIHVLSDLHLERASFPAPGNGDGTATGANAVILAGDTASGTDGIDWARGWADGRPVLYVAGNHEFYGHGAPGLIEELRARAAGSSVRVLENDEVVIDDVRILGCTLWSDFDFDFTERSVARSRCASATASSTTTSTSPSARATGRSQRATHACSTSRAAAG